MSEPTQNLIAAIIHQAVADLKDDRYRRSAAMWLMDANGTCPGYCVALDIDYGQFTGRVKKLIASTVVKVRALRKVTPSKPRGRPRKAATKRARA